MRRIIALTTAVLITAGCGGPSYPETHPVTGVVTNDGKPVEGADVVLVSSDPAIRSAGGMTDAQGHFSVKTYFDPQHQPEGAMAGEYAVTVTKREKVEGAAATPEQMMAGQMKFVTPKSLLPKKYGDPKTSGFKVTVKADAPTQPLKLELK